MAYYCIALGDIAENLRLPSERDIYPFIGQNLDFNQTHWYTVGSNSLGHKILIWDSSYHTLPGNWIYA